MNGGRGFTGGVRPTKGDRAAAKVEAREAAVKRGRSGGVADRYGEGFTSRLVAARDALTKQPLNQAAWYVGKGIAKTSLKVAGTAAVIVGTGGLAAPVMAAVWGRGHLRKGRDARSAAILSSESRQAATDLADAQGSSLEGEAPETVDDPRVVPPPVEPRLNREPVVTGGGGLWVATSRTAPVTWRPAPVPSPAPGSPAPVMWRPVPVPGRKAPVPSPAPGSPAPPAPAPKRRKTGGVFR